MTVAPEPSAGLLVIAVDRLPAWILPAYGATWVAMPALDRLAARGVVFDRLITTTVDPLATLRQVAGGPSCLGAGDRGGEAAASPLGAAIARRGFPAAVITDDGAITAVPVFGTGSGAPRAAVRCVAPGPARAACGRAAETALARLMDAAVAAVAAGFRCVFCQVSSLGTLWDAPDEYRGRYVDPEDPSPPRGAAVPALAVSVDTDPDLVVGYRQAYAGQLTLLDEQIGRVTDAVEAAGRGWTVLVVGTRGLPLGLHGWLGTGQDPGPFGEIVHVPAILVDAAGRMAGQRYAGLVTPADVGATLAELAGGEPTARREVVAERPWCGRSLAGLFESWGATERDRVVVAGKSAAAIVTRSWHAVLSRGGQLPGQTDGRIRVFAKPDDYFELLDVSDRQPDLAERLGEMITASEASVPPEELVLRLWLDPSLVPSGE